MHTRTITNARGIVIHFCEGQSLKPMCKPETRFPFHFKLFTPGYNRYCETCMSLDLKARYDAGEC
jgi:hypothetical protein